MKYRYRIMFLMMGGLLLGKASFEQKPIDAEYAFKTAFDHFVHGKYDSATYWFDISIKEKYNIVTSYAYKAGSELFAGNQQAGKKDLDIGFTLDSASDELFYMRGRQYLLVKDYDSAIFFFRKAIKLNPAADDYYDIVATTYEYKGNRDSARKYEDRALLLNPASAVFQANYGAIEYDEGHYETALFYYGKALDLCRKYAVENPYLLVCHIAECKWKLKQTDEALSMCDELIKANPALVRAYSLRGNIYIEMGKKEKACADFSTMYHVKGKEKEGLEELKLFGCPIK